MICDECKKEGKTSRVTDHGGGVTLLYYAPYYDEKGVYHRHDMNTQYNDYQCSNGHKFTVSGRPLKCISCNWPNDEVKANA